MLIKILIPLMLASVLSVGYCQHKKNKRQEKINLLNEVGKANTEKFKSKNESVKYRVKQELNKRCKPTEEMTRDEKIKFFRKCHMFDIF